MMTLLTEEQVRAAVIAAIEDVIADYKDQPDTDRDKLIEELDEHCDNVFSNLVQHGPIGNYECDDLVRTAHPCAMIISVAEQDSWVEDDSGLWEGQTFGVLAGIAFFSLRNLLYEALKEAGHDTNDNYPFAVEETAEA